MNRWFIRQPTRLTIIPLRIVVVVSGVETMIEHNIRLPISGAKVSETVITAVAAANGVDETDIEPLYAVVDPDALNDLFKSQANGRPRANGQVSFTMAGCEVVIDGNRAVEVALLGESKPLLKCVNSSE